jgi:hypothetical protein
MSVTDDVANKASRSLTIECGTVAIGADRVVDIFEDLRISDIWVCAGGSERKGRGGVGEVNGGGGHRWTWTAETNVGSCSLANSGASKKSTQSGFP